MRLKRYLTEITKPSAPIINNMMQRTLPKLYKELDFMDWKFDDGFLASTFTTYFLKYGIKFYDTKTKPPGKFLGKGRTFNTNVRDGQTWADGSIGVYLSKGVAKRLSKIFRKGDKEKQFASVKKSNNPIFNNIFDILVHEWTHRMQALKSKGKAWNMKPGFEDLGDVYFADTGEIEAYAQQAATEFYNTGSSEVLKAYSGIADDKTRKRFLKKFYQYLTYEPKKKKKK